MTTTTTSATRSRAASRVGQVADTGAHGPPTQKVKRPGRARRALAGALFALMAASTVTTAATPAHAADPKPAATAPAQPVAGDSEANHAIVGTYIRFANDTRYEAQASELNSQQKIRIAPGQTIPMQGRQANLLDMASTISLDGAPGQADSYGGDNPSTESSWVMIGGQKLTGSGIIRTDQCDYEITYDGNRYTFEGFAKMWTVKMVERPNYEFVHHTGEDDGVKGVVVNETDVTQTVEMGGGRTELKPRERILFYDAHEIGNGRGTFMRIYAQNTGMYDMSLIDPYWVSDPRVEACLNGQHHNREIPTGDTDILPFDNGYKLQIHHHPDGPLSRHGTKHTSDWAKWTVTIKNT